LLCCSGIKSIGIFNVLGLIKEAVLEFYVPVKINIPP